MIRVCLVIFFFFLTFVHGQSVPAARAVRYGEIDSRQFMHFAVDLAWLNLPIIKGQQLQMRFSLPDRTDGFQTRMEQIPAVRFRSPMWTRSINLTERQGTEYRRGDNPRISVIILHPHEIGLD